MAISGIIVATLGVLAIVVPSLTAASVATLIIVLALIVERCGQMPKIPALKMLGSASFAIYLFQQFAFDGVTALQRAMMKGTHLERVPGLAQSLSIVAATALGLAIYLWIERPLTLAVRIWANAAVRRARRGNVR